MKVLELYSGIGGMHLSLLDSGVEGEIVASVDINTVANTVYKLNFPESLLLNRNIQSLTSKFINSLQVDTILMSPPCQPFTRNGLKGDVKDARTCSFSHILNILPELNISYILIENVKGFETSEMRNNLTQSLEGAGFVYQEFILSPTQLGVPNTRHRYYCLAKKRPLTFNFAMGLLLEKLPNTCDTESEPSPISHIIEERPNFEEFELPDTILQKRAMILDICHLDSRRSCCFTKAYGRYAEGTGSVFTDQTKEQLDLVYSNAKEFEPGKSEYVECLRSLRLRYFTPREVCRLMCFPESFDFPDDLSNKQKYMLLGNSINIKVVSELIKILVDNK